MAAWATSTDPTIFSKRIRGCVLHIAGGLEGCTDLGARRGLSRKLVGATIYERLISEGIEVPDHAMSEILVELAQSGQIKLTMDGRPSRDPRKYGSMTIRSVSPELCS
jgi:hypothetical protein